MKIYMVGGCVRDKLLGLEPKDYDYVVVGSTHDEMISKGFKQVGADFPVYLHPESGDEYALARTERKVSKGYNGFECDSNSSVTIKEDLYRRDLTINAMALDEKGELIDPYGGEQDIKDKVLREVSSNFSDDPVRVLRLFRFHSTLGSEWTIPEGTLDLCDKIIANEFNSLTAERVWKETEKALSTPSPQIFFKHVMKRGGKWFKELSDLENIPQRSDYHPEVWTGLHTLMCIEQAAKMDLSKEEVFSTLCHDFGKSVCYETRGNLHGHEEFGSDLVEDFCKRIKAPKVYTNLAIKVCKNHGRAHTSLTTNPNKIMRLFEDLDCIRKPEVLYSFLKCCKADARGRLGSENNEYLQQDYLLECFENLLRVDTKEVAKELKDKGKSGEVIGKVIRAKRISKIKEVKTKWKNKV